MLSLNLMLFSIDVVKKEPWQIAPALISPLIWLMTFVWTEEVVKEGDEVMVKVIELDRTGRIKLSRKDAIGKTPSNEGTRPWVL